MLICNFGWEVPTRLPNEVGLTLFIFGKIASLHMGWNHSSLLNRVGNEHSQRTNTRREKMHTQQKLDLIWRELHKYRHTKNEERCRYWAVNECRKILLYNPVLLRERMPRAIFEGQFRANFGTSFEKALETYKHPLFGKSLNVENGIIIA